MKYQTLKFVDPSKIDDVIAIIDKSVTGYTTVVDEIAKRSNDPFKILISTIISARTKDEVTEKASNALFAVADTCLLYTSTSPRDGLLSRMPSSA